MEAGEQSVSTNISEDETEEDTSTGETHENTTWLFINIIRFYFETNEQHREVRQDQYFIRFIY